MLYCLVRSVIIMIQDGREEMYKRGGWKRSEIPVGYKKKRMSRTVIVRV